MNKIIVLLTLVICFGAHDRAFSADSASDLSQLLALHEKVLEAHRKTDIDMLMEDAVEQYVLVTSGEVLYPTVEERKLRLGEYFSITRFDKYEDSMPPVVKISADGSLAWLIARVSVTAEQDIAGENQSFDFVSAWIELYEKQDGRWVQIGNVSNFKP
jgi:hypothetical protein